MAKRKPAGGSPADPRPTTDCEKPGASPCKQCPFKKTSMRGYTGPHKHFVEILQIVHKDGKFPCHMRVNAILEKAREKRGRAEGEETKKEFDKAWDKAPFCTGALAYANNTCKLVRHPSGAPHADRIGERDDVFQDAVEAQVYHHGERDVREIMFGHKLPVKTVRDWVKRKAKTDAEDQRGRRGQQADQLGTKRRGPRRPRTRGQ